MAQAIIVLLAVISAAIATRKFCSFSCVFNVKFQYIVVALVVNQSVNGRLLGGVAVNLGQVPHMASLRSLSDVHFCGGSIISNRYILTSAMCTVGRAVNGVRVVVGTVTLNAGGAAHISSNITLHPAFDRATLDNE